MTTTALKEVLEHDYADQIETLGAHPNPFALVTADHLHTRQIRGNPQARYPVERALVRMPYRQGWDRQRIL